VILRVQNLVVLVERRDDGTIALLNAQGEGLPDDFFASCNGAYEVTGEKYDGVPYPFRAILQSGYGQALKTSQDAQKSA